MDIKEALKLLRKAYPKGSLRAEAAGTSGKNELDGYETTEAFVVISGDGMGAKRYTGDTLAECVNQAIAQEKNHENTQNCR